MKKFILLVALCFIAATSASLVVDDDTDVTTRHLKEKKTVKTDKKNKKNKKEKKKDKVSKSVKKKIESASPTSSPTTSPTNAQSGFPTGQVSTAPTGSPSGSPTGHPSDPPTGSPSGSPTGHPSDPPTGSPSGSPTGHPSVPPTGSPSGSPSETPSRAPVQKKLIPYTINGGAEFDDPTSYQSLALQQTEAQNDSEELPVDELTRYYALLCLFYAAEGDGRICQAGWTGTSSNPCDWYGITCNSGGRVEKIELYRCKFAGFIPPEVSMLSREGLHKTGFDDLTYIDVSNNNLRNDGDSSWMIDLGPTMTHIDVAYSRFFGRTGDIPRFPQGNSLQYLSIAGNERGLGFNDTTFENLEMIETLDCSRRYNFGTTIPSIFSRLPNLKSLSLRYTGLSDNLLSLGEKLSWTKLDLSGNSGITGTIPKFVENFSNLTYLDLSFTGLTGSIPTELGNLLKMKGLDLSRVQVNGTIPSELGRLTEIEDLKLGRNALTGSIPTELGRLTEIVLFYLESNALTGSIPTELGRLTDIVQFFLYNNALTGSIPTELGNLKETVSFELHCNQLNGTIPTELGQISGLRSLDLSLNDLSGGIPSEIGSITGHDTVYRDFWLRLADNQLTGTLPPEIATLSSDPDLNRRVLITGNNITGDVCKDPIYVIGADCNKVDCPCCACCNTDECAYSPISRDESNELRFLRCSSI